MESAPLRSPQELSDLLWALYESEERPVLFLLDMAIEMTQNAVDSQELDAPTDRAKLLFNLGVRLDTRYSLVSTPDDLHRAISAFEGAVQLTSDGGPGQIEQLTRLGTSLLQRFELIEALDDFNSAATTFCCAAELMPDSERLDKSSVLTKRTQALEDKRAME